MENRFKRLRYEDDLCLHKIYTMDELAEKLQISKATISHLEASEDYDARVSILKRYKAVFPNISYDYMLGAKNTISNEYSTLEHTLPLGDRFYETLKNLFCYSGDYDAENLTPQMKQELYAYETEMQDNIRCILECIFSNSDRLFYFLLDTFKSLFKIYLLENPTDNKERFADTDDKLAFEWYKFTQDTMDFFKTVVYENMQPALEAERAAAQKRHQEIEEAQQAILRERLNSLGVSESNIPFD